ncbi:SAM-dependent methyltransferase [Prauserella marina]|uniref:Methyltransferase domain-containing protein n=1 Tax=Prauserella marina TaxID=530584 RepID=A0A222VQB4_9PSEU|nr:class I SAM-dependent methyltransferase [Prauserella marina]ASR36090.1 SAM-dependent methyltransferase [Prauserella marina]PWV76821.1 methyltransferase family protein [Prauserella marina]SDC98342.1 Methyltransferase domain-containing protein [Prauserella marina]
MDSSVPRSPFDDAYEGAGAPWIIDEPQPAIVELERRGEIHGAVLDAGCGMGEHTIYLAERGYDVVGVDFSVPAIDKARANAARRGVTARFDVADATRLTGGPRFDTVVDSALFHVFGPAERVAYTGSLHGVCVPGARVHVLALADTEPGLGPQISDSVIREAFTDGWELENLRPSTYRVVVGEQDARRLGLAEGTTADMAAWLARARRL